MKGICTSDGLNKCPIKNVKRNTETHPELFLECSRWKEQEKG